MAERERLAAISVDLDETHHYRGIHALPPRAEGAHAAYDLGVERAIAFARALGAPLTLFAVGDDLGRPENADRLQRATVEGHAVESHSMSHRYDLARAPSDDIRREVVDSFDTIERVTGRRPVGFRAPGYTMSRAALDALETCGAEFDSSILPSPPYAAAKLGVLAAMALRGRRSASIVGSLGPLFAPTEPYRPGSEPHRVGSRSIVELPILVTRGVRFPVIGTSLGLAGERGARLLMRACGAPWAVNLELHALDFVGEGEGIADVAAHEPQLRVPLARRVAAFEAACGELSRRGYRFVTLAELAWRARATKPRV